MRKEFVSSVDGRVFSSEDEALSHLFLQFVEEKSGDSNLENMKSQLEVEFPFITYKVNKRPFTSDDTQWQGEDDAWFQGKEMIHFFPTTDRYQLEGMGFTVHDTYKYKNNYEQDVFESLDEAIIFYKRFIFGADRFAKRVLEEIRQYDTTVIDCVVTKISQTYGTADSFNEYHYSLVRTNGEQTPYGCIELNPCDLESDAALYKEIEIYVKRLTGRYLNVVEGIVSVGVNKYCNDHEIWYQVDGIAIENLVNRAKILKIEILEGMHE